MARKVIAEFDAIDGPFINKLRAIDASVTRFEVGTLSAFGRVEKGMNGLLASAARLQNVSGIIAGGFGASLGAHFLDQATRIRRALKEAGDDSQEAFEKAFLAAQRSVSGFEAFAQGVQRMRKATDGTFDDSVRNMETLNKLLVLGGKTTQERMSTMIQFSQALQANVLQGEELRSLRENAPIELVRAIAREAGGTIQDLKELGSEGKLTTDVMIRALKSLEQEADLRMRSVTLTVSEAATQLANSAIVAGEGFDRGLGLTRATVAGLTGLANILGENAEAAEMLGKALQVGLGAGLAVYAGSKVGAAVNATRQFKVSLYEAAVAADANVVATQRSIEAARAKVAATSALVDKLSLQAGSERRLETANRSRQRAISALTAAERAHAAAVVASTSAQANLLFSTRALAGAGRMLQGAFAFLGGWPGILFAAGTAFLMLRSSAESAAERFERLTSDTGDATRAVDMLRDVQSRLNDALAEAGKASDESHRRIIANTREELAAKRDLLALETKRLEQMQAERRAEIERLRGEVAGIYRSAEGEVRVQQATNPDPEYIAQIMADADAKAGALNDKIRELSANMTLTGQTIASNNALLAETAIRVGETGSSVTQMIPGFQSLQGEAMAFAAWLKEAWYGAEGVASTDMASGIAAAGAEAKSLAGWLQQAYGRALAIAKQAADAQSWVDSNQRGGAGYLANQYALYGQGRKAFDDGVKEKGALYTPFAVPSDGGGGVGSSGSSGGGAARVAEIDREALQLIESMMTAEERRAQKIKEAVELRGKLVEKYGAEHEMVQRVDEAIQRMNESLEEGQSIQEQFWQTMSDSISQNINEWKGWGSFLRSLLSSFVSQYGEDFFTALFSPGGQYSASSPNPGSWLGDVLTGQLHSGGGKNQRSARSVPAAAFLGAPRFHKGLLGLKSDEFTAILQDGETVLPKGVSLGGAAVNIVNNNDFRGVSSADRAYVEGRLKEMERQLPDRVVMAVKDAQSKRRL